MTIKELKEELDKWPDDYMITTLKQPILIPHCIIKEITFPTKDKRTIQLEITN